MYINQLSQIEEGFKKEIKRVNVLFELGINEATLSELRSGINILVDHLKLSGATERLRRFYPHCWAVYLVAEGIYGYDSGDYWSGTPVAGSPQYQRDWGRFFERYTSIYGLQQFTGVGGQRFITPILLHGGIPSSTLPTFFDLCLWPAILSNADPRNAAELLDQWSDNKTLRQLSKPVIRFLQHGGTVATEFVERCLDMGCRWISEETLPKPSDLGLPKRVVDAFQDFLRRSPEPQRGIKPTQRLPGIRAPRLKLDPFGDGPFFEIPSQVIASATDPDVWWIIVGDGPGREYRAFVSRIQGGWQTERMQISPGALARKWTVSIRTDVFERKWQFIGPTATTPYLAFDSTSLELLPSDSLPASHVWMVFPHATSIHYPEPARVLENGVSLLGNWEGWTCRCFDFSGCEGKGITVDGKQISIQANAGIPYLYGGKQSTHWASNVPFYVTLPELRIPITGGRTPEEEASRWDIHIVGEHLKVHLGQLKQTASSAKELYAAIADVLDEDAIGQYEIHIRGPLGRSLRLPLNYIGSISISDPPAMRIPTEKEWPPVTFRVKAPVGWRITTSDNEVGINSHSDGRYEVCLSGKRVSGSIEFSDPKGQGRFTLPIVAPALQWALVEGTSVVPFVNHRLQRPRAILDSSDSVDLLVGVAPLGISSAPDALLEVTCSGRSMMLRPLRAGRGLIRFNLREAADFTDGASFAAFKLKVQGKELPVLNMTEHLQVEHLGVEVFPEGGYKRVVVRWIEKGRSLPNRCLRLWPLSRPWREPIEEKIPDDVAGQHTFLIDKLVLPPGMYRAEISLVDPWSDQKPVLPAKVTASTGDVSVGDREEHAEYVNQLEDTFEGHLEAAMALEYAAPDKCRHHLQELERFFESASMPMLLAAILGSLEDEEVPLTRAKRNPLVFACKLLLEHADRFAIELAGRASCVSDADRRSLVLFLIGTGLLDKVHQLARGTDLTDSELDALWHFWPVLGLMAEADLVVIGHPEAWQRMENTTGMSSVLTQVDDDDLPQIVDIFSAKDLFGGPLGQELSWSAEQLRAAGAYLGLAPRGVLEKDSDLALIQDWLLGVDEDRGGSRTQEAREVLLRYGITLRNALEDIADLGPEYKVLKERICDRLGTGPIDKDSLGAIPFTIGATALINRVLAYPKANTSQIGRQRDVVRNLTVKAYIAAPDLFTRDLCLIELALTQLFFTAKSISPFYDNAHA